MDLRRERKRKTWQEEQVEVVDKILKPKNDLKEAQQDDGSMDYLEDLKKALEEAGYPVQEVDVPLGYSNLYNRELVIEGDEGTWSFDYIAGEWMYVIKFTGYCREFTEYREYVEQVMEVVEITEQEVLDEMMKNNAFSTYDESVKKNKKRVKEAELSPGAQAYSKKLDAFEDKIKKVMDNWGEKFIVGADYFDEEYDEAIEHIIWYAADRVIDYNLKPSKFRSTVYNKILSEFGKEEAEGFLKSYEEVWPKRVKEDNPRDYYNRRQREIDRENKRTLSNGSTLDMLESNFEKDKYFRNVPGDHLFDIELGTDPHTFILINWAEDNPGYVWLHVYEKPIKGKVLLLGSEHPFTSECGTIVETINTYAEKLVRDCEAEGLDLGI